MTSAFSPQKTTLDAQKLHQVNPKQEQNGTSTHDTTKYLTTNKQTLENHARLLQAITEAKENMRKYLNTSCNEKSWLVKSIREMCTSNEPPLADHGIKFEATRKAAKFNHRLLKKYKYNLEDLINAFPGSIISPGAEFRPTHKLQNLFQRHSDWKLIQSILDNGADYPIKNNAFSPDDLKKEVEFMIKRGNHKSSTLETHKQYLDSAYNTEVEYGWQIPTTVESLLKMKDVMIIPLGVARQLAVNEKGEYKDKFRITHDCSFRYPSGFSLNESVDMEAIPDCKYGKALIRFLHQVHLLRLRHPKKTIWLVKTDLDAAYRRLHVTPKIALLQVSIVGKIAYIGCRLPFGSSPAPALYSVVSDAVFDLANDLLDDEHLIVDNLHSPNRSELPAPIPMDPAIEYGQAKPLLPPVVYKAAFVEGYIDDGVAATIDGPNHIERLQNAVPLAVHTFFRPLQKERLPRKDPLSKKKLQGEGAPSEEKIVLGWTINTRRFSVNLPLHKHIAWTKDINRVIENKSTDYKEISKLVGRLTHTAYIFHLGRYFLNRIRKLERRCEKYGPQKLAIEECNDLVLWKDFLTILTTTGVSINNITSTKSDGGCWSDACEHGLGGFCTSGAAFSYHIPPEYQGLFHINLLEFIAARFTLTLAIRTCTASSPHIIHQGDNTSAKAWLRSASFDTSTHPEHNAAARSFARAIATSEARISSNHIPGRLNAVADSLSRDTHLSNEQLTFIFAPSISITDSTLFQTTQPARRNNLRALISQATMSQQEGLAPKSDKKHDGYFLRWLRFLDHVGITDTWLEKYTREQKNQLICAFAEGVRHNFDGRSNKARVMAGTVSATIGGVCATFRKNFRDDPGANGNGKPNLALKRQLQHYENIDPATKHQKALPVRIFTSLWRNKGSHIDTAIGELTTFAFFFALRSCEYTSVSSPGKTQRIRISDVQFFTEKTKIPNTDPSIPIKATTVSITFRNQKNGEKMAVITHHRTNKELCPVVALFNIVQRVLSYKGTNTNSYINTFLSGGKLRLITSTEVCSSIRNTVEVFGKDDLGFGPTEVGTHSIRSSTAMQLFLGKIPTYQIMIIGRWSSDAFLKYIRRQVQEFSEGLSSTMTEHEFSPFPTSSISNKTTQEPEIQHRLRPALQVAITTVAHDSQTQLYTPGYRVSFGLVTRTANTSLQQDRRK